MHMSMGSTAGVPSNDDFPKYYWAVVASAIGVATLVNIYNHVLCAQRLSAARSGTQAPAKPRSWFALWNATIFAMTREASNFSIHVPLRKRILRLPTVGRMSLVLANAVTLVVLCLYGFDLNDKFMQEDIAYRCGVITLGQLPLIFLLSGKNNIIGYLSGISYERLNWLHRWCARCMLLTTTMHMGYFFTTWARYDYIGYKLKNDGFSWTGLTAWSLLVWIVFSSMTPIRGWNYELFVVQHLISFTVFVTFIYLHIPPEKRAFVWIPVALFFFDRTFRALRTLYANLSVFHPKQRKQGQMKGFWACKADFTPLPHNTTRVVIQNPPISWAPGQHVFLSCHSVVPLQNHPFTVATIPEDGRMEFLIQAKAGGTKRFYRHAEKTHGLSEAMNGYVSLNFNASRVGSYFWLYKTVAFKILTTPRSKTITIEGPYGYLRPMRQFDSVVLFAGSSGATFTISLLRDILQGWAEISGPGPDKKGVSIFGRHTGAVTRHVRFVWVVKSKGQLGWFSEQLSAAYSEFQILEERLRDIKLELTVYVTCDESFTDEHKTILSTVTAPNHDAPAQKDIEHGTVQYRGRPSSVEQGEKSEKEQVRELTDADSLNSDKIQNSCGPNGTCCCRTAVDESATSDNIAPCCCCSSTKPTPEQKVTSRPTSNMSSTAASFVKQKPFLHPAITVYAGRPRTRDIIRRSLEQALGESAVVVCGPEGLVADVKQDVCSLSDERAVHKGTGAQGIYLHTESYSY